MLNLFFSVTFHSTFGGNPLASAVAIASLEVIKEERLAERY
jgi:ornithine--oxo-acid transaminase